MSIAGEHEIEGENEYSDLTINGLPKYNDYYYIIDSKRIADKKYIQTYINLLKSGFGKPEAYAMCFNPRHVLKYESLYGEVTALICFECRSVSIKIGEWNRTEYFVKPVGSEINELYKELGLRIPLQP
ncbi:MAG: hypothetical protein ACRBCS_16170 [Cellvibrionaceae bacterium]